MHKHVDSYHATKLSGNLGRMQPLAANPHDRLSSYAFFFFLMYSYIQCVSQQHMISARCVHNVCICGHVLQSVTGSFKYLWNLGKVLPRGAK